MDKSTLLIDRARSVRKDIGDYLVLAYRPFVAKDVGLRSLKYDTQVGLLLFSKYVGTIHEKKTLSLLDELCSSTTFDDAITRLPENQTAEDFIVQFEFDVKHLLHRDIRVCGVSETRRFDAYCTIAATEYTCRSDASVVVRPPGPLSSFLVDEQTTCVGRELFDGLMTIGAIHDFDFEDGYDRWFLDVDSTAAMHFILCFGKHVAYCIKHQLGFEDFWAWVNMNSSSLDVSQLPQDRSYAIGILDRVCNLHCALVSGSSWEQYVSQYFSAMRIAWLSDDPFYSSSPVEVMEVLTPFESRFARPINDPIDLVLISDDLSLNAKLSSLFRFIGSWGRDFCRLQTADLKPLCRYLGSYDNYDEICDHGLFPSRSDVIGYRIVIIPFPEMINTICHDGVKEVALLRPLPGHIMHSRVSTLPSVQRSVYQNLWNVSSQLQSESECDVITISGFVRRLLSVCGDKTLDLMRDDGSYLSGMISDYVKKVSQNDFASALTPYTFLPDQSYEAFVH